MKFISSVLILLACLCHSASYARTLPSLPDTLAGQSHLIRQLSAEACEQLLLKQKSSAFSTLSAADAQKIFEEELSAVIEKRVSNIRQLAARSEVAGAYEKLRALLPTAIAIQLVKTCQPAAALYGRFQSTMPTSAERALLEPWANELCSRLKALKDTGSFRGKTSAERIALFHKEFLASLNTRGPQIMRLYGPAGNSPQVVGRLSQLVSQHMQEQCTPLLQLLYQAD